MSTSSISPIEVHERSWEAIDSLLRTLGSTLEVKEIVLRGMLTVSGQLVMKRVGLYLLNDVGNLELCGLSGIRRQRLSDDDLDLDGELLQRLGEKSQSQGIFPADALPKSLQEHFNYVTTISDGEEVLGLLLLGGKIGSSEFSELNLRLLATLGMVLGTAIQRSLAYEKMVQTNDHMQRIQDLQKQIIDHVSHEFNTPLMILKGSNEIFTTADDEQRKELQTMHSQAVDRLENLIGSVLEVGQSSISSVSLVPLSHLDLVESCVMPALDASPWPREQVWIENRVDPGAKIQVDQLALLRAVRALLDNAWRYGGEKGSCLGLLTYLSKGMLRRDEDMLPRLEIFSAALEGKHPEVSDSLLPAIGNMSDSVDTLVVEIADAGIGIPCDELTMIFEPFTQASNSPTRYISGTGMGLPLTRRRVEAMGGELRLASRENLGTLLAIFLPVRHT